MTKVKFISFDYLQRNSAIEGNLDANIINPYIYKAQDIYIHPILGTALYTKLKNDVKNKQVTNIYKTILQDYVQPTLLEYSVYVALPFISLKLTNKSVSKQDSKFSQSAELQEVKWLRSTVLDVAEFQAQRLTQYLKANINNISEYKNPGTSIDTILPNSTSYFNGIYIGNGGKSC